MDIDFQLMLAEVSGYTLAIVFVSLGVFKSAVNFSNWAIFKVSTFFSSADSQFYTDRCAAYEDYLRKTEQ